MKYLVYKINLFIFAIETKKRSGTLRFFVPYLVYFINHFKLLML